MDDMLCKKCGMTFDSRAVYGYACPHGSNCGPIEPRTELWLDPMPRVDVSLPPPVGYVTREEYDRLRDELAEARRPVAMPQAWLDVIAERERQVSVEGWTPEHDDTHANGEMARAAGCYALTAALRDADRASPWWPSLWPWAASWWKPTNRRRDLVKAGALVLAELERLDRADSKRVEG
jgi:hypothetical protein